MSPSEQDGPTSLHQAIMSGMLWASYRCVPELAVKPEACDFAVTWCLSSKEEKLPSADKVCPCGSAYMFQFEDHLQESVLSPYHVGSGD